MKAIGNFFKAFLLGASSIFLTFLVWLLVGAFLNDGFAGLAAILTALPSLSLLGGYVGFQWELGRWVNSIGVWCGFELPQYAYAIITLGEYNFISGFLMLGLSAVCVFVGHRVAGAQRSFQSIG